jgi:hypothetical protein
MTKRELDRRERVLPGGEPRYVRCYDCGDETVDRYTVVFTGRWPGKEPGFFPYLAMSGAPFHPQGFAQHGETRGAPADAAPAWPPAVGRKCHLGVRIKFSALPEDCRACALRDYKDYWRIRT